MTKKRAVDQIDQHIGQQLRMARKLRGMTMMQLGALLKISYQQLQKYEKGHNRLSASKLWAVSRILEQPLEFFFAGLATQNIQSPPPLDSSCLRAAGALNQITDKKLRQSLIHLIEEASNSAR